MSLPVDLLSLLTPHQKKIEEKIASEIKNLGPSSILRDACEYALKNGGKRFRPALVYLVAEAIGKKREVSPAALAVEYFHTASLIADDLPCMDDETLRRNHPTVHRAFGESVALLASYALISAGYEQIRLNAESGDALFLALENASYTTGLWGATGGQFLDLFPPTLTEEMLRTVIERKTGALFELSFVLGWLFGGGEIAELPSVKKAAHHFGMAFQIVDDFDDLQKDQEEGRQINYPALVGPEKALAVLENETAQFKIEIKKLRLDSPELLKMIAFLESAYSTVASSSSTSSS